MGSKKGKAKKRNSVEDSAQTMQKQGKDGIVSDILGSYTGTPEYGGKPDQDADDL